MRKFFAALALAYGAGLSESSAIARSLFEARGLAPGRCYREVGALHCAAKCSVDFFPTTQGQLTLEVGQITELDRKTLGRLFEIDFRMRVGPKSEIEILHIEPVSVAEVKGELSKTDGMFRPRNCPRTRPGTTRK